MTYNTRPVIDRMQCTGADSHPTEGIDIIGLSNLSNRVGKEEWRLNEWIDYRRRVAGVYQTELRTLISNRCSASRATASGFTRCFCVRFRYKTIYVGYTYFQRKLAETTLTVDQGRWQRQCTT